MRSCSAHPGLCSFPLGALEVHASQPAMSLGHFGDVALTVRFRHSASTVQAFGSDVWTKRLGAKL